MNFRLFAVVALLCASVNQVLPCSIVNNTGLELIVDLDWYAAETEVYVATTSITIDPDTLMVTELPEEFARVGVSIVYHDGTQDHVYQIMLCPAEYEPNKSIDSTCFIVISRSLESGELQAKLIGKMLAKSLVAKMAEHKQAIAQAKQAEDSENN